MCPTGTRCSAALGSGLAVLEPGEADDIIIAGMGAETIIEILEAAPWVFDARYNLVLVPATKHSILRRWLARRGFALRAETLCQAAGRWYAVMNAQYTGAAREPDGLFCLTGLTNGQPGCSEYYAVQNEKLKKYRLGLPDGKRAGRGSGAIFNAGNEMTQAHSGKRRRAGPKYPAGLYRGGKPPAFPLAAAAQ